MQEKRNIFDGIEFFLQVLKEDMIDPMMEQKGANFFTPFIVGITLAFLCIYLPYIAFNKLSVRTKVGIILGIVLIYISLITMKYIETTARAEELSKQETKENARIIEGLKTQGYYFLPAHKRVDNESVFCFTKGCKNKVVVYQLSGTQKVFLEDNNDSLSRKIIEYDKKILEDFGYKEQELSDSGLHDERTHITRILEDIAQQHDQYFKEKETYDMKYAEWEDCQDRRKENALLHCPEYGWWGDDETTEKYTKFRERILERKPFIEELTEKETQRLENIVLEYYKKNS